MTKTILRFLATAGLVASMTTGAASAANAHDGSSQPAFHIGDHTYFADGTVEVDVPPGTFSLGQCDSGQFCIWSLANYSGSFRYKTGSGLKTVGGTVGSFWNNRSTVARLYSNTGASSTCYENGARKASVTSGYSSASEVNLQSGSSC
ncbi:MAG: peptidase inhibitor family I36 protein [Aeromicrobium sp.]